ncbi:RND superfamily putative drug exporter [Friedmanniella endophytica]|uniref:RND superfamily putative drug exporter n=1 Tax=Microlunatus kandeliicorticis TaxID=1759536 RepID=A0A7W3P563_9ACTN|nr:MMPL family transporter [Microlunatus kandeliicorticis]MBA8793527.1 RND superfamily putative drug exporter [Microlunatus kandeliicorticis]
MSSYLYGLAKLAIRRRLRVLLAWLAVLVVLGGAAGLSGANFEDSFSLPGTESQQALDSLKLTFPQVSGAGAQVIVVAPEGQSVRTGDERQAILDGVAAFKKIDLVDTVSSPFDQRIKNVISDDGSAAIISVQLSVDREGVTTALQNRLEAEGRAIQAAVPGSTVSVGGDAFQMNSVHISATEGIGVVVALIVLFFTLGSLRAAGMPLLTALLGVGVTMAGIVAVTALVTVSSTTPMLALMLGLAVGIDYALFITSRHRDQLRDGMEVGESIARSVATAGSAVVFAGLTVMIALAGLSVAGIPFLTTMGIAAAVGVAVAVVIALTLLPALLAFAGERLRPKPAGSRPARKAAAAAAANGQPAQHAVPVAAKQRPQLARSWVRLVTKVPALTIAIVVIGLGALALPAQSLRLSLPDNGTADVGTPARTTYDLVADHFGPGYNGPLIVTAKIVGSNDPLGVMDKMGDEIRALPGVASVPLATPNQTADTGIVQVIPTTAPDAPATADLVERIRALEPHFKAEYGVDTAVTGITAIQIDVSNRLGSALLPFGVLVVGLSLVLLTMVFRSIAVPLKATIGYLLSVLASFGATSLVFIHGWLAGPLNVEHVGPVISFLPILLMGILFGLAMDYEVFLVSRIREDFVHGGGLRSGDPHRAIETGFVASSRVVVAAAVIMFAVFAAFVPEGTAEIKTIAFGLAVGVFVDAFIVRMTLVPAVLALLGRTAWKLPRWIDERLPTFDVEGEALAHQVKQADWPVPNHPALVYAEGLAGRVGDRSFGPIDVELMPGQVVAVPSGPATTALLWTLTGRMKPSAGEVKALGLVLPQQGSAVRRRSVVLDARAERFVAQLRRTVRSRVQLVVIDHAGELPETDRAAVAAVLGELMAARADRSLVIATDRPDELSQLLPAGVAPGLLEGPRSPRVLDRPADLVGAPA